MSAYLDVQKTLVLSPSRDLVWEWMPAQHFKDFGHSEAAKNTIMRGCRNQHCVFLNTASYVGPNKWYDAGDERFHPDNIITDDRGTMIFIISKETGEIVWKVGPEYTSTPALRLFVLAAATLSAVASGLLPALRASAERAVDVLGDESRGATGLRMGRFSRGLVVLEIALSFGLLVGAGVMIKSIVNLARVDPGFATEDVFTVSLRLSEGDYPELTEIAVVFEFFSQPQHQLLDGGIGTMDGARNRRPVTPGDTIEPAAFRALDPPLDGTKADPKLPCHRAHRPARPNRRHHVAPVLLSRPFLAISTPLAFFHHCTDLEALPLG